MLGKDNLYTSDILMAIEYEMHLFFTVCSLLNTLLSSEHAGQNKPTLIVSSRLQLTQYSIYWHLLSHLKV